MVRHRAARALRQPGDISLSEVPRAEHASPWAAGWISSMLVTPVVERAHRRPRRSCLSVPGHAVRMHEKALGGAGRRGGVRSRGCGRAGGQGSRLGRRSRRRWRGPEWAQRTVAVRVNAPGSSELAVDLELVRRLCVPSGLTVVVPKVEVPERWWRSRRARGWDWAAGVDRDAGGDRGGGGDRGLDAAAVRADPRLCGSGDGARPARSRASTSTDGCITRRRCCRPRVRAGVQAIDGPFSSAGRAARAGSRGAAARELGFDGKWAIHPEQVEPLNRAFV